MLLQTNSYVVPKEKRAEHARLLRRFRQTLARLGCDQFEVFEQVGANWMTNEQTGRYVQIMRFRDRKHQMAVQTAERADSAAQALIAEFCDLINFPYQQQQGLFAVGFYTSALPVAPTRAHGAAEHTSQAGRTSGEADAEAPPPPIQEETPLNPLAPNNGDPDVGLIDPVMELTEDGEEPGNGQIFSDSGISERTVEELEPPPGDAAPVQPDESESAKDDLSTTPIDRQTT